MTIVSCGFGIVEVPTFVEDIVLALTDEPEIVLDPDIVITLDADGVDISVDPDIDIEVE